MRVMNNLALMLQERGKWDEAEMTQRKVPETCKAIVDENHSETLTAMSDQLAYTYYDKSSLDEAMEVMEEAASRMLRILGTENEATKSAMAALNMWKTERQY